jgi:hypothetical protein
LDNTTYAYKGKDKGHEGKIGHLNRSRVRVLAAAAVLVVPALPVFPRRISARIRSPAVWIIVPVIMAGCHGCVVVTCPTVAPGIIRFAFLHIGQDVVCCN